MGQLKELIESSSRERNKRKKKKAGWGESRGPSNARQDVRMDSLNSCEYGI